MFKNVHLLKRISILHFQVYLHFRFQILQKKAKLLHFLKGSEVYGKSLSLCQIPWFQSQSQDMISKPFQAHLSLLWWLTHKCIILYHILPYRLQIQQMQSRPFLNLENMKSTFHVTFCSVQNIQFRTQDRYSTKTPFLLDIFQYRSLKISSLSLYPLIVPKSSHSKSKPLKK